MDETIKKILKEASDSLFKEIEKYKDTDYNGISLSDIYLSNNSSVYYKQSNFTYYFIKYLEILNFYVFDTTINLNTVIDQINNDIIWYKDDQGNHTGLEFQTVGDYEKTSEEQNKIETFINNLPIGHVKDLVKFQAISIWFYKKITKFDENKFHVYFNGSKRSTNINDYILLTSENQKLLIDLLIKKITLLNKINDEFNYELYKEFKEVLNDIDKLLIDSSKHEIFDITELQNILSSFDKKEEIKDSVNNPMLNNNFKILYELLYFINNGQINTKQCKEVQNLINDILSKLNTLPNTNDKIIKIIEDIFPISLTSNRIGKTFTSEEFKILNMQNQASETLKDLINNKMIGKGDYFISSTTGDIRDSLIYLLTDYEYSNNNNNLNVVIIGINPLTGEKEKMQFDLLNKSLELNKYFNKCDYLRLKNIKELPLKDRQHVKLLGTYNYKI